MATLGGVHDSQGSENSFEIDDLARFAVAEHNKKEVSDSPTLTSSDLGLKQGGHCPGWNVVPTDDPQVQDAAEHALKTLQQRSNSLFPYELKEIVHAKAEVIEESAKYEMLLKVKRGSKEEKLKVEVHKNDEGTLHLNHMEPHSHSD